MFKRIIDLLISVLLLPVAIVFCVIGGAVTYFIDGASPVFSQKRVGMDGKVFTIYKLRTMHVGTRDLATHEVSAASVTTLGSILRKTKIDELPQLVNVLNGSMSLVGPRPGLPTQTELFEERNKRGVFSIRPGITGPSQIKGLDMSEPELLAISDAEYVSTRTNMGDMKLLVQTFLGAGRGDKVRETG